MKKVVIENGKVVSISGEIKDNVIKDLSGTNTEDNNEDSNNKAVIITDSKTNIKLNTTSDIVSTDTKMEITEITSGATFDKIKNILVEIKNFKAFDITLKSNNTIIQPNGKVKISIPIPVGYDKSKLIVYRIADDGIKIEYEVTVDGNYATFETEHFSTYVLGETEKISNEANNTKLPQTGEENNAFVRWLSIAISLGIFWICSMLLIDREKKKMAKR